MSLQKTVQRAYTTAFAGQLVEDGPRRARPARILTADPANPNRMSRAFTWGGELAQAPASPGLGYVAEVQVGGDTNQFFGILGQPYSYAMFGSAGNSLAPSQDLPAGALGEFFDMATALCVEIFNEDAGARSNHFGDRIAFAAAPVAAVGIPTGGLIALPPDDSAAPAGYIVIPNARLVRPMDLAAAGPGAPVSALGIIQLTQ